MDINANSRIDRAFLFGILLNLTFTAFEFAAGFMYDSLALLSDALHNLGDTGSLLIALIAFRLARRLPTKRFTFGLGKTTILASLINAAILLVITGGIIREAIARFSEPVPTQGTVIMIVAGLGIVINTLSAALFFRERRGDLNMKGAFLHLAVDALVSAGVVVSGLILRITGWAPIDPLISVVIALVIIWSTWGLFRESLRLTADAVPEGISYDEVIKTIEGVSGVKSVHHVHIWAISTTLNSLTAHVVLDSNTDSDEEAKVKDEIRSRLGDMNIAHATLETEPGEGECLSPDC
jgi:cobalt-zinc-cadmium efflux system protein